MENAESCCFCGNLGFQEAFSNTTQDTEETVRSKTCIKKDKFKILFSKAF